MSHYRYTNLFPQPTCNLLNELMNKMAIIIKDEGYAGVQACGLFTKNNLATTTTKCPDYQLAETYTEPWYTAPYHGRSSSHQLAGRFY